MLDAQAPAGAAKPLGAIAGTVVSEDSSDSDTQAPVIANQARKEAPAACTALVAKELAVGNSSVVVDRHVQELVSRALRLMTTSAGNTVSGAPEARQALDVQVYELAGLVVLVALHCGLGIQRLQPIKP